MFAPTNRANNDMFPAFQGKTFGFGELLEVNPDVKENANKGIANCKDSCLKDNNCLYVTYDDELKLCRQYVLIKMKVKKSVSRVSECMIFIREKLPQVVQMYQES